jgi:cell division protein FtsB
MTEPNTEIITDGAPNVIPVQRDLKYELAATYARVLELKEERSDLSAEIKKFEDRMKTLLAEIKQGGAQLEMHFATQAPAETNEPQEEETDEEVDEEQEH